MPYQSQTVWQTDHYLLEITCGHFNTRAVAGTFGNTSTLKWTDDGRLILTSTLTGYTLNVTHPDITVYEPKDPETTHTTFPDDYQTTEKTWADITQDPEFRSIESLAYGIQEVA